MSLDQIEVRQTYMLNRWVIAKISKKDPRLANQQKEIPNEILKTITSQTLLAEFKEGTTELEISIDEENILKVTLEKTKKKV